MSEEPFSGTCVLLVEDDIAIAEQTERQLKTLGYGEVLVVTSLNDAQEVSESDDVEVALLDVNMADGMQTVGLGRALAANGIRVLFMSGFNPEEMARATRGFEFVEKPLSLPRLKAALHRAFVRTPAVEIDSDTDAPDPR